MWSSRRFVLSTARCDCSHSVANIAIDLYGMTATLSRVSSPLPGRTEEVLKHEKDLARLFCKVRIV